LIWPAKVSRKTAPEDPLDDHQANKAAGSTKVTPAPSLDEAPPLPSARLKPRTTSEQQDWRG
jgi:hypothetical protein